MFVDILLCTYLLALANADIRVPDYFQGLSYPQHNYDSQHLCINNGQYVNIIREHDKYAELKLSRNVNEETYKISQKAVLCCRSCERVWTCSMA